MRGSTSGLVVRKAFSALPLERLGGPIDDRAVAFFVARARYARYLLDLGSALALDA